jgi:hypothetical protein
MDIGQLLGKNMLKLFKKLVFLINVECRVYMTLNANTLKLRVGLGKANSVGEKTSNKQGQVALCQKNQLSFLPDVLCQLIVTFPSRVDILFYLLPDALHFIKVRPQGVHKRRILILGCS